MPDVIRHPCGFAGGEWIPASSTGMTGEESHAGRDPASMQFCGRRMDSRVKHGNDRRGVVMPDVIRHPCGFTGGEWIPVSSTGMTGGTARE